MGNDLRHGIGGDFARNVENHLPEYLSYEALDCIILAAFAEDLGKAVSPTGTASALRDLSSIDFRGGDLTTNATVPDSARGLGNLVAKQNGVLAGAVVATRVFCLLDDSLQTDWYHTDGDLIQKGDSVAQFRGSLKSILTAERTMLNFLQRMSGIATATHEFVDLLESTGTRVLDTRKTAPGLRLLDKWAVKIGGGENHRLGLYDEVMIKDNHIVAAGGIRKALHQINASRPSFSRTSDPMRNSGVNVVVEVSSLDQIREIMDVGGVDRILLDNMVTVGSGAAPDVSRLLAAVKLIGGKIQTEASGNVTLAAARDIAETGVDFISVGALTHSVSALDLSLLMEPAN